MKFSTFNCSILCACLLAAGCSSNPGLSDYKVMQTVYKQQSLKDQQTISDLRRDLDAAMRALKTAGATSAASEGKLSEVLRRADQQRDELSRAKDERTQLASQQTTQIATIIRQLTEELARAREDRSQFAQTMKAFTQHMVELQDLKQAMAEAQSDPRLQSVETALNKQNEALAALQLRVQAAQESIESQRQSQQKVSVTPSSGKRKTTTVPKDNPLAPKDTVSSAPTHRIVVKAGDSLNSLAQKYGISPADLKELNRLATDDIQVGQSIVVPSAKNPNNP